MKTTPISVPNPNVVQTRPRQTALPTSRRFASELRNVASVGAGSLLRVGGAIMGAALPAANISGPMVSGTALASSSPDPLGSHTEGSTMDQSMELLALQQQIQMENQRYTTLSNVLKARHETNKSAISNLR